MLKFELSYCIFLYFISHSILLFHFIYILSVLSSLRLRCFIVLNVLYSNHDQWERNASTKVRSCPVMWKWLHPASTETVDSATVLQQILLQMQQLGDKMDLMDRRVQRTEAAQEQGTSQVSSSTVTSHNSPNPKVLSNGIDTKTRVESVVPLLGYLRDNESVQAEVNTRLGELAQINETATKDRLKSKHLVPADITVKRIANFVLTGSRKTRPSYDDLTMAQWVSGFVRCVQEEKSEAARASMLDYLGNLMEDASDFSSKLHMRSF